MRIGDWRVDLIVADRFRLDGGAMFGIVPKVKWERLIPPDGRNRNPMASNVLLLRNGVRTVLVESGNDAFADPATRERLALEDADGLMRGLAALGIAPGEVTDLVLTHLHLDHAGGATRPDASGRRVPSFPCATVWVQAAELEDARRPHPRAKGSYVREHWEPLADAGLLRTVDGLHTLAPGLLLRPLPGHNRGNQGVVVEGAGARLVQPGDLIPTRHHLPPTWCMGYDLDVVACVDTRQALLEELADTDALLAFGHDPEAPFCTVARDAKGRFRAEPVRLP